VQAESLYEAAVVLTIELFREDPWQDVIEPGIVLNIEGRAPGPRTRSLCNKLSDGWQATPTGRSKKAN
jgi:hypothetical protein